MLKIKKIFALFVVVLLFVGCSSEKPSDDLLPTSARFTILVSQQTTIDADAKFLAENDIVTVTTSPSLPHVEIQIVAAKCKTLAADGGLFRVTCYETAVWRDYRFEWGIDYKNVVFEGYALAVYKNE